MINIENLKVSIENKEIVKGINLEIQCGEIHAIMGPNGSGKTTLSYALSGHPSYQTKGKVLLHNENLLDLSADERAKKGFFLSFQSPPFIEGISLLQLMKKSYFSKYNLKENDMKSYDKFRKEVDDALKFFNLTDDFIKRDAHKNFSGGEKKKAEMLQMLILKPTFSIIDEVDSGLDVDALKIVAKSIKKLQNKDRAFLIITHYNRILKHVEPTHVHIMKDGKIVKSGSKELAQIVEEKGYLE